AGKTIECDAPIQVRRKTPEQVPRDRHGPRTDDDPRIVNKTPVLDRVALPLSLPVGVVHGLAVRGKLQRPVVPCDGGSNLLRLDLPKLKGPWPISVHGVTALIDDEAPIG